MKLEELSIADLVALIAHLTREVQYWRERDQEKMGEFGFKLLCARTALKDKVDNIEFPKKRI